MSAATFSITGTHYTFTSQAQSERSCVIFIFIFCRLKAHSRYSVPGEIRLSTRIAAINDSNFLNYYFSITIIFIMIFFSIFIESLFYSCVEIFTVRVWIAIFLAISRRLCNSITKSFRQISS